MTNTYLSLGGSLTVSNVSSFMPLPSISGLTAWFRSDLGVVSTGGIVSAWKDQSGLAQNVSSVGPNILYSGTGGAKNLPYLSFNDSELQGAFAFPGGTNSQENFIICSYTSLPGNAYLIDFGSNKEITLLYGTQGQVDIYNGNFVGSTTMVPANTPFVADSIWSNGGASDSISLNGATPSVGSAGGFAISTQLTIGNFGGGNNGIMGAMYEVIIFDRILLSSERNTILNYITARYGFAT